MMQSIPHQTKFLAGTCLALAAITLASCSSPSAKANGGPRKGSSSVPVHVVKAGTRSVPVEITTFGTVQPAATVNIKAQISGPLMKIHFSKGDLVKKGDLLFTIDPRPFKTALEQAEGTLERDRALAGFAQRDAKRSADLEAKSVATITETDKSRSDAASLSGTVRTDEAAVANARLQLDYTEIRSPIDGRTGNRLVDEGNYVKSGETTLVTIAQVQPVEVFFCLPQADLPQVRSYMAKGPLEVRAKDPQTDVPEQVGRLTFVDNVIDTGL
ncbi:MAG: efflux RND transporter periplasmic adaptor subunit [Planctomycetaceae bacterium]|nr:efflux RND transporter periplasmic adaptor subunit [Planctomycetaceae bacterium]